MKIIPIILPAQRIAQQRCVDELMQTAGRDALARVVAEAWLRGYRAGYVGGAELAGVVAEEAAS